MNLRAGPAPMPTVQALNRLRTLLTVWFTAVLALGVVILVASVSWVSQSPSGSDAYAEESGSAGQTLALILAGLGSLAVAGFAPLTWMLLGQLLNPANRALTAQESFLGAVAHDLRTPLATLSALITTAREDPETKDEALQRASRLIERSGDTVEDLLLRARLASGTLPVRPRAARLDQVVEAVIADLSPVDLEVEITDEGAASVRLEVDGHTVSLLAEPTVALLDPVLAERAVANLVANALRHGHRPGEPARIAVTVGLQEGRAVVTVADAGPGLRPPVGPAGLGLSVVRWVARAHDGALLLGAGPQPGTRIRLAFPVPAGQALC
ncbi:sensor histidine kinase [Kineosporia babensis]|uniref:Sensor-like histidine kinase SenX3 n=1 Tax=Kineosporia babensis TaxID=499548 RepID=A0A9X1ST06_9ACTN|nr:HAMP domain-containing sensor histidine kinase [Kineosporia babensis]MCD5311259.1 HAMP domain-containing histidine kinase [Kineosporia babensis]